MLLAVSHLLLLSTTTLVPAVSSFSLATTSTRTRTGTGTRTQQGAATNRIRTQQMASSEESSSASSSSSSLSSDKKNPEIAKQLERAKAALAKSRAKMEAQEQSMLDEADDDDDKPNESLPFFAAAANADPSAAANGKKDKVIKNKNEDGLFTTDGEMMAKLSEEEEWESRPLLDVFQNEKEQSSDAMNIDRDIGQSMYNLRKSLQMEDFQKIFDKRNRFIGEA
eukprot:jgi/Psemu1/292582/fgenesh1_pg.1138_\